MNAEQLLTHFDRIVNAPDAIPRLRRFILDLAVRGKLVEQDPSDEPAGELLRRIAAEKARLTKTGEIKKTKALPPISEDHVKFETPKGWSWCRLGSLSKSVTSGSRDWAKYYSQEGAIFIRMGNLSKEHYRLRLDQIQHVKPPSDREGTRTRLKGGDLLISITGDVGMLGLIPENFGEAYINQHTAMVRPVEEMKGRYLAELFRSPFAQDQFNAPQRGIKNSFRLTDITQFLVPLPSLAEQHRIVAKVDELMALCDRLETARKERENTRNRLMTASLVRLNAPDPDPAVFQNHGTFALDNLAPLTTRPAQIKALRQTILNLAVRGKLVEQDSNDEPALELIERARDSMSLLVKSGEVATMKAMNPLIKTDELFPVSKGWQWVRLGELSKLITKGSSPKWQGIEYVGEESGVLFITSENVGNYTLTKMDKPKYVETRFNQIESRSILQEGDILLNLVGASIGRSALFDLECTANINQAVALIRPVHENAHIVSSYLLHYLNSPVCVNEMLGSRVINAQPNISLTDTRNFLIPLPPLAEQHRIVAKVDELMVLCDRLEASLTTSTNTQRYLLDSSLHHALDPNGNCR